MAEIFVIQAQQMSKIEQVKFKDEVLDSREEALRENPFAGLFPSLKEAAAHKSSVKEEDVEPGLIVELEPELLDQEVKAWEEKADSEAKCDPKLKAEVVISITNTKVVAGEEIDKCDISFPHEPGAGTMEKATLVKLMSTETRLKCAIKALDSLCNTEVETLNWDKLERISGRLEEHWSRYEDAFTAYKKLFNQYSTAADERFSTLSEAFLAVDQRAWTLFELSVSGGSAKYNLLLEADLEKYSLRIKKVQLDKVEMYWYSMASLSDQQGDESKLKAEEVKNIAKQRLTTQDQLWQPWMSEVQEKAKLSPEAKEVRAAMRAKLNLVIKVETEAEIIMKALAKEECLVRKLASSACCDEVEKVESDSMIDELAENSASNQLEEEEKMSKEETDLEADKLVAPVWIESRPMENFAEAAEQLDFKELMLRQHNLNTKEVEKHVDAKQPNYIVKVETEAKENRMHLKEAKQSLKVEKDWQGSALLVFDKQDLVGVSLTKKVEMKLMHVLKAEAVWVRNKKQNLMKEELLVFYKQYVKVVECEKEGHEALELLVDKQAAAAG